jgi:hypothetical protein
LSGHPENVSAATARETGVPQLLGPKSFWQLCKLGLAITWPLVAVAMVGLGVLVAILLRPH